MKSLPLILLLLALGSFSVFSQTNATREIVLDFQHKELADVLQIYADLTHRTVLHAGDLPGYITFKVIATNIPQALQLVTQALEKEHLAMIMDGEKFVLVVPDSSVAHAKAVLAKNPSPVEKVVTPTPTSHFPAGAINFPNCPLSSALGIYQQINGAKGVEANPAFPLPPLYISLLTQTPLTRMESIHAFNIVFGLNGITMVPTTDNKLKAVPFEP